MTNTIVGRFSFDMSRFGRQFEGIAISGTAHLTVDDEDCFVGEIVSIDYNTESYRRYVDGLGPKGTADYWIETAKEVLLDDRGAELIESIFENQDESVCEEYTKQISNTWDRVDKDRGVPVRMNI